MNKGESQPEKKHTKRVSDSALAHSSMESERLASLIFSHPQLAIERGEERLSQLKETSPVRSEWINLTYHQLGEAYNQVYRYAESVEALENALTGVKVFGDSDQLVDIWLDLAAVKMNLQEFEQAEALLNDVYNQLKAFPEEYLEIRYRCRIGYLALHNGQPEEAIDAFVNALETAEHLPHPLKIKDHYFQTLILSGLGKGYEILGIYSESFTAYEEAAKLRDLIERYKKSG